MDWDQGLTDRLDAALNESSVRGFTFDAERDEARLFLEVFALPDVGLVDLDFRRIIVISGVSTIEVTLREEIPGGFGPTLPLDSMAAVESFFARLTFAHPMYGWAFIDITDLNDQWSATPSLRVSGRRRLPKHTLHWFTECGPDNGDGLSADAFGYYLQGMVSFDELRVERADGKPISVEDFAADGVRWWKAFNDRDGRVSVRAQQETGAAAKVWWPDRFSNSAIVPAGPPDTP